MIKRYFYIFSATLFILLTPTTGVKANIDEDRLEELARKTNSPPEGFNYQAVLRDDNGEVLANSSVTMRFTLSSSEEAVWIETHTVVTDAYGVIALVIGEGTQAGGSAASFGTIDWSADISVKIEADSGSGFVDLGTSSLQSVPYAAYAANGLSPEQEASLDAINLSAEENVQADWNETDNTSDAFVLNKPSIPTDINELTDEDGLLNGSTFDGSFNSLTDVPAGLDIDATDDFSGNYDDLTNKPFIPSDINELSDTDGLLNAATFDGSFNSLTDVPVNLDVDATDDFSGSYNDLSDLPANLDTDATDDFSGSYDDLTDVPANLDTDASDDFSGSYNDLTDLPPDLDTDSSDDFSGSYNDLTDVPVNLDIDSSDDFSGSYNDLSDLPSNLDTDATDDFSGSYSDLTDLPPNLDTDATDDFSGSYNDLTDLPTNLDTDATDDFSGSYNDLTDLPANLDTDATDDFSGSYSDLTDLPANLDTDATDDFSGSYNDLTDLPANLDTDSSDDFSGSYNDLTDIPVNLDIDSSDDFSGSYNDLSDLPSNLDTDATDDFSGSYNDLTDLPANLDTDATDDFSGSYNDLTDIPVNLDTDVTDDFSGSYNDLTDLPANLDTDATDDFSGSYNDLTDLPANLDTDSSDDFSGSYNDLTDIPANLDTDANDDFSGSYNDLTDVPVNIDTDASDDFSGSYNDLTDLPANLDTDSSDDFSGSYNDLTDLPTNLDTDSSDDFSGSYNDLTDVPTNLDTDATDDFSGDYNDLANQPTIPTNTGDLLNDAGFITNNVTGAFTADQLIIDGGVTFPTTQGSAGQVLTSNGSGGSIWSNRGIVYGDAYNTVSVGGAYELNSLLGLYSTAIGAARVETSSFGATVTGSFNSTKGGTYDSWVETDALFIIGNGWFIDPMDPTGGANYSDAMVVRKNGNTDINGDFVANSLGVDGQFTLPTTDGTAGQVLSTDGSGTVDWSTPNNFSGSGSGSFVAGASGNTASGSYATVSGGGSSDGSADNQASGDFSTVGGGRGNKSLANLSFIGGGAQNYIDADTSFIGGGFKNYINTDEITPSIATIAGGKYNNANGRGDFIGGGYGNRTGYKPNARFNTIAGGENNANDYTTKHTFIGGGRSNRTGGAYSTVAGGSSNFADSLGTVGGGFQNSARGFFSTIPGGHGITTYVYGGVALGMFNSAGSSYGVYSTTSNATTDPVFVIGNGDYNSGSPNRSDAMVMLKNGNTDINGDLTVNALTIDGAFTLPTTDGGNAQFLATFGNGTTTWADPLIFTDNINDDAVTADKIADGVIPSFEGNGNYSFVGVRNGNYSYGNSSFVGGGRYQVANGEYSAVVGGESNYAMGDYSFVGGGNNNRANERLSTVGGGSGNWASGEFSVIPGGRSLQTSSYGATVLGIYNSTTGGSYDTFVGTDPILVVGNGIVGDSRSDAMVMLKNGNTDINGTLVANSLGVDGVFTLPTADGTDGQVLTTDGSGNVSWGDADTSPTIVRETNASVASVSIPNNERVYVFSLPASNTSTTITMPTSNLAGDKIILSINTTAPSLTRPLIFATTTTTIAGHAANTVTCGLNNTDPTMELIYDGTTWLPINGDFTFPLPD